MANFAHEVDPGLEEFLVKPTVQGPDSGQLRDAEAGLESLRLGIAALLPGLTAAAAGTVAVIKTFADSLTETFYAAQKLGSTTEHVTALGDAAERAGAASRAFALIRRPTHRQFRTAAHNSWSDATVAAA
jgi:hypothetical protein